MRPNGFGGPHSRPPPTIALPGHTTRQDEHLLSPPTSSGAAAPAQNGWTPQTSHYGSIPGAPPKPGPQRMPPGNLAGGFSNLSLNGGPPQSGQSAQYLSKAPIGGGKYVQQQTTQQQPPSLNPPAPAGHPPSMPSKLGLGSRGPPAFGKGAPVPALPGARPLGNAGRPASPSSPNKYASIPMPTSPSPTTSRAAKLSQHQAAQMPLPPNQPRGLAPPSFSMPQQVCTMMHSMASWVWSAWPTSCCVLFQNTSAPACHSDFFYSD